MDGKVLFVRYGNFIRRVPVDRVIPAQEYKEVPEEEADPDDVMNKERLEDDDFTNVEIITKKDKEIEALKKANQDQEKLIEEMSRNVSVVDQRNGKDQNEKKQNEKKQNGKTEVNCIRKFVSSWMERKIFSVEKLFTYTNQHQRRNILSL